MPGPSAITRDDLETLTKLYVHFTNRSIDGEAGMFSRSRAKTTADEITTLMMEIQVHGDWTQ